ncbi:MAG: hypothetical protein AAGG38_01740 [Planctomycetota bacterium]
MYHRIKKIWADGGYSGEGFAKIAKRLGREVEIVMASTAFTLNALTISGAL